MLCLLVVMVMLYLEEGSVILFLLVVFVMLCLVAGSVILCLVVVVMPCLLLVSDCQLAYISHIETSFAYPWYSVYEPEADSYGKQHGEVESFSVGNLSCIQDKVAFCLVLS